MNILGINFGHDAAVTLIRNGKIIQSIEEEKISRIKQDFGWPQNAVRLILSQNNLMETDIHCIAFGGNLFLEMGASEIRYLFNKSRSVKNKDFLDRILAYIGVSMEQFGDKNISVFEKEIRKKGFTQSRVKFYNHHLCHASSAYYCSPFLPDLVITCDGHGDGESFNFYINTPDTGLTPIVINSYKESVGAFYSCITQLLSFRPTRHEGKITGLAAFGKHSPLVESYASLFAYNQNTLTRFPFGDFDAHWQKYRIENKLRLREKINLITSESSFGMHYDQRYEVLKARIEELSVGYSKEDMAYACQKVAEQIVVKEIERVLSIYFPDKKVSIGLAGGVFANVRINQMIYEIPQVSNIFIQPAMGDSGLSLGAGILASIELDMLGYQTRNYAFTDTYLGPDYSDAIPAFLKSIQHEAEVIHMAHPAKEIAQMMKDNLVVGFWHGSMEWGPRALGKRSIILNTFDSSVNDSVNKRLSRTEFMPFAPSIIDYMMKTYIPTYDPTCPASNYMTITYDVSPDYHELLQAVVHVDGTARPQLVSKDTNPYFYEIIDEFYKLTGCGAIVNTSFNAHEEPIVGTPESAYKALKEDRIDVLVIDHYLIKFIK